MTIRDLIFDNFVTLSLIAGLAVLIFSNRTFDKRTNHYFMCFIGIVLLLDITDIADYYMAQSLTVNNFRYITSALGYTLRPASLAISMNIFLRRKEFCIGIWIPIAVLGVIAFTSYHTHAMYWFNYCNYFKRGPLGFSSHILSMIYAAVLVFLTIRSHHMLDFGEILVVIYMIIICTFASFAESKWPVKFLLPGAMAVSCAMYYIFLYVETYKRDALTGLRNRRSLYADVEKMSHQKFVVISMDLNGLKDINDNNGHHAGDKALRAFAEACITVAKNNYRIYRTGGDEFLALGKEKSSEEAQNFIHEMRDLLKKKGYMSSFGYAHYCGVSSFTTVFKEADANMYKDKKHYKHRMKKQFKEHDQ